jgi:predicted aminopeptidase
LRKLYASGIDETAMQAAKDREFADFRRHYQQWRDLGGAAGKRYDTWMAKPINNARLLPFGLYDQWTPAFAVLFQRAGESWPVFYGDVRALARESRSVRDRSLQEVMAEQEKAGHR